MTQSDDKIWVALLQDTAFARVQGRATFKIGPALKQFAALAKDAGCKTMLFDMEGCAGMDSTFMGVLAGIAERMKREVRGEVILANLTPRTRGLVATLGLDALVLAYAPGELPETYQLRMATSQNMKVMDAPAESRAVTAETMLKAHEQLVAMDARNLPRFKDVVAFLQDDLKKAKARAKSENRSNDPA